MLTTEMPPIAILKKKKLPLLKTVNKAVGLAMRGAGYELELRRLGDSKLGIWRKHWRRDSDKRVSPKRFVVVPGFGDSPMSWLAVLGLMRPVIRKRFDEIAILDFPGYHGSLCDETAFESMDSLIQAVGDAFDSLKPEVIFGHSLGGWLTARYAIDCARGERPSGRGVKYAGPEQVIVSNPSGAFASAEDKEAWRERFLKILDTGFAPYREVLFRKEPKWFRLVAHEFAEFFEREDCQRFMRSVRDEHFVEEHLGEIKIPVWVLWGAHDRLAPFEWMNTWTSRISGSRKLVFEDVGHSPHIEKPLAMASVLGQILAGREPESAAIELGKLWRRS